MSWRGRLPFSMAAGIYGGGGFLLMAAALKRPHYFKASLEYGLVIALDLAF